MSFYPDKVDVEKPVLLNTMGPMSAAFVGARLLRAMAARGGTRVRPSASEKLEGLIGRALPDEVLHHCEAEAERILEWLDLELPAEDLLQSASPSPELDIMVAADLESRLSVARFALEEDYDLELEYFDEESKSWPRLRAALLEISDESAADFHTALLLRDAQGEWEVPLKHVRWLMPVPPRSYDEDDDKGADVLQFPGPRDDS